MSTKTPAPTELTEWMEARIELLTKLVRNTKTAHSHQEDTKNWTIQLLNELSNIEAVSRRGVHLLTAYALRSRLIGAAEIATATNVTVSTAQNRGGSRLAQEVWNEVYPTKN